MALALIAAVGCNSSRTTICGDNICATNLVCAPELGQCVPADRLDACAGKAEGSACSASEVPGVCTSGVCLSGCGDNVVESSRNEECDGPITSATCESFDFYVGTLGCTETCEVDTSGCSGFCGDLTVNGQERCDDDEKSPCVGLGYDRGLFSCTDCEFDFGGCFLTDVRTLPNLAGSPLQDISATPRGFVAVGTSGVVVHVVDGERIFRSSGVTKHLFAVWAFSDDNVYAAGTEGVLLHYDGTRWSPVDVGAIAESLVDLELRDLWGIGDQLVAVGIKDDVLSVLRFDGQTWTQEDRFATNLMVAGVSGLAINDFYVVANRTIEHFDGVSWEEVPGPDFGGVAWSGDLFKISVLPSGNLWIAGYGVLFERRDNEWTRHDQHKLWRAVTAVSENEIFVKGQPGLWRYDGSEWTVLRDTSDKAIWGVVGDAMSRAGGVLYSADYDGVVRYDGTYRDPQVEPYEFPTSVKSIAVDSSGDALVMVGDDLFEYTDSWTALSNLPANNSYRDEAAFSPDDELFLLDRFELHRRVGSEWTTFALSLGTGYARSMAFAGGDLHGVTTKGYFKFSNDEITAVPVTMADGSTTMEDVAILHMDMAGTNSGFAVGSVNGNINGIVFRYDGSTWSEFYRTPERLLRVAATADGMVFTSDVGNNIYTYDGLTWTSQEVGSDSTRQFVAWSSKDVLAVSGTPHHFDGQQWAPIELKSVDGSNPYGAMAQGSTLWLSHTNEVSKWVRGRPWTCDATETTCSDGIDNDCDGFYDSGDSDCPP